MNKKIAGVDVLNLAGGSFFNIGIANRKLKVIKEVFLCKFHGLILQYRLIGFVGFNSGFTISGFESVNQEGIFINQFFRRECSSTGSAKRENERSQEAEGDQFFHGP